MPLKSSRVKVRSKRISVKTPKGYSLEGVTPIKRKKSTLVGFTYTKTMPTKAPKYPGKRRRKK